MEAQQLDGIEYALYWEDIEQRLFFGSLCDDAWRLAENLFGYKKHHSMYVFQNQKLAAFYSVADAHQEAEVGCTFYSDRQNVDSVITLKKRASEGSRSLMARYVDLDIRKFSDVELRKKIFEVVEMYLDGLSVHYLTQPQFFERFEISSVASQNTDLRDLASARFEYSKSSWVNMLRLGHLLFGEYARRHDISLEQAESLTLDELKEGIFKRESLMERLNGYAIISRDHQIRIVTGTDVDRYIQFYDEYIRDYSAQAGLDSATGIVGNRGGVRGIAFVIDSEQYNPKHPPQGMKPGMVLIVQNAWPELQPYFQMAAAIVTNEGGITSHGVVVARELGIPCIVGTKVATKIFKTGDLVKVDACPSSGVDERGVVRILR